MPKVKIGDALIGSQRECQRFATQDPFPKIPFAEAQKPLPTKAEAVLYGIAAALIFFGYLWSQYGRG